MWLRLNLHSKASGCLVFDTSYHQLLVETEKIYFDPEPDLGESEILGYAVGPRWRINSSSSFASVEIMDTLCGGDGFGKWPLSCSVNFMLIP